MRIIDFYKKNSQEINLLTLGILFVFVVRLLFSFLPSFGFDMGSWLGWANRLSSLGFGKFYTDESWTQYTPGFMYYLWAIGKLGWVSELAIKIPTMIADIGVGDLIWSLVKKVNSKLAILCFFLYTLNPVVIFDGSIWGQIDGILTLMLLLSAFVLIERKSLFLSTVFWSVAFLIKPQSIAVLPAILMITFVKKTRFKELVLSGLGGLSLLFLLSWPFFIKNPILGLPQQILKMGNYYSYTSVFAFNIWSWVGFWKPDTSLFLGISLAKWGVILLVAAISTALYIFRNKLDKKNNQYFLLAILSLCFFVFPTKVHERYLFPFFAFLLTSAGLSSSINLFIIYAVTSLASFFNLYYPYSYYYPAQLKSEGLYLLSQGLTKIIGFIFLSAYFVLLFWEKLPKFKLTIFSKTKPTLVKLPKSSFSNKQSKTILALILLFASVPRTYSLGLPKTEYFDEVYHAFTAKVILHNDPKAWEWWNTPPTGFAYEWTHPPIAKLGMVIGMKIFGENSFGWRIPGALLGVGSVFLVYLIAKKLFEDEMVGLISGAVFCLLGLPLGLNRVAIEEYY